jgi:hypothetical protein
MTLQNVADGTVKFKHRYVPSVPQIRYRQWSDKAASKEYWPTIDSIAYFIGAALSDRWYTIEVVQTKEKWGDAIVYCSLAEPESVLKKWEQSRSFQPKIEVPDSFRHDALIDDANHYRTTYQRAFSIWPQYFVAIRSGASFPGLLCQSKEEFDELFDSGYFAGCGFEVNTPEKRQWVYDICEFK